jgi:hypothetical protein
MENNTEFQEKKKILDDLYKNGFITGVEWYESLSSLLKEYDLEKEINSD